jgi:hypothetical protein
MIKTVYWDTPRKYSDLEGIVLPYSFHFITSFIKGEKYILGFLSTFEGISDVEMRMIGEGF